MLVTKLKGKLVFAPPKKVHLGICDELSYLEDDQWCMEIEYMSWRSSLNPDRTETKADNFIN